MNARWTTNGKCVFNLGYHLIWCPKYRRKILIGDIEKDLKKCLYKKAKEIEVEIVTVEIMPDHVHLFVKSTPTNAPHFIVGQFKGYSSWELRDKHPELRKKLPCVWTRSYYCESVGHISEDIIKKYIEDQKNQ